LATLHGPVNVPPGCEQPPADISHPLHKHFKFIETWRARSDCACRLIVKSGATASAATVPITKAVFARLMIFVL
jgi:hypothetical protein